jgi:hypothetical protein
MSRERRRCGVADNLEAARLGSEYLQSNPLIGTLSVALMIVGAGLVLATPWLNRIFGRSYKVLTVAFFVVTRVGLLLIILHFAGRPTGPDNTRWTFYGVSALEGLLPYLDYASEYGPLFSYALAPLFLVFSAGVAPIIAFVVFDFFAFLLLNHVAEDREFSRRVAVLYLVNPLSWFMIVRYGQDESLMVFFAALLLILARKRKGTLLAVFAGLGAAFTKVLFALPALPILVNQTRRGRAVSIAAAVVAACYAPFLILGGNVFDWTPHTGVFGGPSVWTATLISPAITIGYVIAPMVYWKAASIVSIGVIGLLTLVVILKGRRMGVVDGVILLYAGLMLFSTKAWPHYALLGLPFLAIRAAKATGLRELLLLSVYSFLVVFYFYIWLGLGSPPFTPAWSLAYGTVLCIIGYHAFLLVTSLRAARA